MSCISSTSKISNLSMKVFAASSYVWPSPIFMLYLVYHALHLLIDSSFHFFAKVEALIALKVRVALNKTSSNQMMLCLGNTWVALKVSCYCSQCFLCWLVWFFATCGRALLFEQNQFAMSVSPMTLVMLSMLGYSWLIFSSVWFGSRNS